MNMTPPIRRVAADASLSIPLDNITLSNSIKKIKKNSYDLVKQSNQINNNQSSIVLRERSTSSSSSSSKSSKSSNNDSLRSFSADPTLVQDDDDDDDDDDDTEHQWNLEQLISNIPLRQLMTRDSLSLLDDNPIAPIPLSECKICLEEFVIRPLSCCSSSICSKCIYFHLSSYIMEARIRIICPSCPHIFTREEILSLLSEINDPNEELSERYKRFYADINGEAHIKTCPRCCSIKEIDKSLFEGIRWKRKIPRKVFCDECQFEWCFFCHAPWHDKMTCNEYQEGEKMLRSWAAQMDQNQHNAQKCPRCKVYISRNGGCPHMVCSKCQCDFCYNCGRRRLGIKFLGSHESRFSPLGCKYNLYPDKPMLRHTVRGLVASAATLSIPVAAVGAAALLAVGATIGAPTYGTYRLVKHIRSRRQARRRRHHMKTISRQWTTNDSLSTYINGFDERSTENDEYQRAVQASLITFREENEKREEREVTPYPTRRLSYYHQNNHDDDEDRDDDDDDDDSVDD